MSGIMLTRLLAASRAARALPVAQALHQRRFIIVKDVTAPPTRGNKPAPAAAAAQGVAEAEEDEPEPLTAWQRKKLQEEAYASFCNCFSQ